MYEVHCHVGLRFPKQLFVLLAGSLTAKRWSVSCKVTYLEAFPSYKQQDATFLDLFISTDAVHVSDGSCAHHQEHITAHTAFGYCQPLLLVAAASRSIG